MQCTCITMPVLYCSLYKYWGQCFYGKVSTLCSVPAADYVMMYLVDGWQPVLYHRYGCEFGNTVYYASYRTARQNDIYMRTKAPSFGFDKRIAFRFLQCDAMLTRHVLWPCVCPSVCLSVCLCLSICLTQCRSFIKTAKPKRRITCTPFSSQI